MGTRGSRGPGDKDGGGWGTGAEGLKVRGPPSLLLSLLSQPSPLRLPAPSGGAAGERRRQRWLAGAGGLSLRTSSGSHGSAALTCAAAALCRAAGPPPLLPAAQGHGKGDSVRSAGLGPRRNLRRGSPSSWGRRADSDRMVVRWVWEEAGCPSPRCRDPRRPPAAPAGGALDTAATTGAAACPHPLLNVPRKRASMQVKAAKRLICATHSK